MRAIRRTEGRLGAQVFVPRLAPSVAGRSNKANWLRHHMSHKDVRLAAGSVSFDSCTHSDAPLRASVLHDVVAGAEGYAESSKAIW